MNLYPQKSLTSRQLLPGPLLALLALALLLEHPRAVVAQTVAPTEIQISATEQMLLDKIRQLKAPRWKSFGNCRYDWSAWRIAEGGVRTTSSICGSPEVTSKVAVHCETLRLSQQNTQGAWGEWRLPLSQDESKTQGGEDLMVANLCANAKAIPPNPVGTAKPGSGNPPASRP